MKKSSLCRDVRCYVLRFPYLLLFYLLLSGNGAFAQDDDLLLTKVSYQTNNTPLIKVLKELHTQMRIRFTYNSELVQRQSPVTVNMKGVTLKALLDHVLQHTGLMYTVQMGGVIIYETPKNKAFTGNMSVILRGRVTDPKGTPLAGVSIRGVESKEMTTTQADGLFMLVAKEKEQIRLSLLGMNTLTYTVKGDAQQDLLMFRMDTVARIIQEVVVNGYQKIDPRLSTGSVIKLSAAEVLQPGQPSIDRMLQGKVPGLMIMNTSGGVNAKPMMRIRGTSTLIGNASPLWVVDGMIRPDPVDISSALLNNLVSGASQSNFELMGNAISGVNPYDIESLTFLKDAAATAIYGIRAANGVIVVTTKRGKAGPMELTYNTNISFQQRPSYRKMDLMNSKERVAFSRQMQEDNVVFDDGTSGFDEELSYEGLLKGLYARKFTEAEFRQRVATIETRNTDWFKVLFRNQMSTQHSLSMSGGAGKTTYYASLSYMANNGAAKMDGNRLYAASLNLRSQVTKRINVDLTLQSNYRKATGYFKDVNPMSYALQTSRIYTPEDFYPVAPNFRSLWYQEIRDNLPPFVYNMQHEIAHTENNSSTRSTSVNLALDYKIGRGWGFRHASNVIMDASNGIASADEQTFVMSKLRAWNYGYIPSKEIQKASALPAGGMAYLTNQNSFALDIRNSIDYTTGFFKDRDQFNFTLGNEIRSTRSEGDFSSEAGYFPERGRTFYPSAEGRRIYNRHNINNSLDNAVSYYGNVAYSMMNRYVLSGTIRTDASNRFGQFSNARFQPNYSISGRWNAGMEKWFPTGNGITDWQIRASYGTQGNVVSAVGPNLIATYSSDGLPDPVTQIPYLRIKTMPYPGLRWEKTYQWNIGTNFAMLNNRLRVNVEYYTKKTVDVLDVITIPFEYGLTQMYKNGNELYNSGWEAMVDVDIIRRKNTSFSVTFSTSRYRNRISDKVFQQDYNQFFTGRGHLPGKPISGFYSYIFKGLDHNTGIPTFDKMDLKKKTVNPDDILVYSGQLTPKFTGTLQPVFRYRSFSVTSIFYMSLGSSKRLNDAFARTNIVNGVPAPFTNLSSDYLLRWRKPGDELYTNIPALKDKLPSDQYIDVPYRSPKKSSDGHEEKFRVDPYYAYNVSDLRTVTNNYLRCTMIQMGYTVPANRLAGTGIKNLGLGFSVNNVFTIANRKLKGQDPETDGIGSTALPITRQYAFSINATF